MSDRRSICCIRRGYSWSIEDLSEFVAHWPVERSALGVANASGVLGVAGDLSWVTRIASVGKLLVGYTALVAIEEGTVTLDEAAGPPGSTVRHLLAHASGYGFDGASVLAAPGERRIYSNTGIEVFADHLANRAGMSFADYLQAAVLDPLAMHQTDLRGTPAALIHSSLGDLMRFGLELLTPTLIAPQTLAAAAEPHFPNLAGVVPGLGRFDPSLWGLTFEIKGEKSPHWTGANNSPATFGHFGGSGTFLWLDPVAGLVACGLTDRDYGDWAITAWPPTSDALLARLAAR